MRKVCPDCNQEKLLIDFYPKPRVSKYPNSSAGYSHICKVCNKKQRSEYVAENKKQCKQSDRKYHLSKYDLTVQDYNQMFAEQEGKCVGCNRHQSEFKKGLVIDHCHETQKVRGLLCTPCNLILGYARDNRKTLLSLVSYLETSGLADHNTNIVECKFPKKVG